MNSLLRNKILWKVYIIWFFRRIFPLILIQIIIFIFAIKIFANNVFVSKVFQNAALVSDLGYLETLNYIFTALLQTQIIVQISILIGLGVIALILRDITRALFTYISTIKNRVETKT